MHGHQINNLSLNIIGFLLGEHSTSTVIYKSLQDMGVCTFLPLRSTSPQPQGQTDKEKHGSSGAINHFYSLTFTGCGEIIMI